VKIRVKKQLIAARIRSWSDEEGQALVEFSLVASILLVVVTGILIFGIFEMQVMSLTEGVNSAGRVLAVSAGLTTDPCNLAAQAVQNAAPSLKPASLSYTVVLNPSPGVTANQTYTGSSCSSTSTTTGAAGYLATGGNVTVTASYSQCGLRFFGKNLMPNGCSISSTITEVVQ
jgi:Flp pilus assembly protein TadG